MRLFIFFSIIFLSVLNCMAQQTVPECVEPVSRDIVVWQASAPPRMGTNPGYSITLSYYQPERPEMMIYIVRRRPKLFEVLLFRAIDFSIETQIERIHQENCKAGIDEILAKLKYERRSIRVTENEVEEIRRQFFKHVQMAGTIELESVRQMKQNKWDLVLHAGSYSASFNGTSSIELSTSGNSITSKRSPDEPPLADWIRRIYLKFLSDR